MLVEYAFLIPLLPALAAAWIAGRQLLGGPGGEARERESSRVATAAAAASFLVAAGLGGHAVLDGAPGHIVMAPWFAASGYGIPISFALDGLGLTFALLVSFLALLTIRFSVNYMHREPGFHRFFAVLSLFAAGMLLIVTAGNAGLMFVGWELAGVSSYLLVGYRYDRGNATANANRIFITNRIGDAGFLLGIFLLFLWAGGIEWTKLRATAVDLSILHADLIGLAFLLAALAKSAQVPFAPWISRALEGPTPSSAIFYGALMVHAGIFLLIRLEPMLQQAPAVLAVVTALGFATALYGWLTGLVQTDVKGALMSSTTAQLGLMFVWYGLGWTSLAAWHMGLHAVWRAYQFLHAPSFMHRVSRPVRPVPAWLARRPGLFHAAQQRWWLDPLADWLLTQPTRALARDVQQFDQQVVNLALGLPTQASALSSLAEFEAYKHGLTESSVADITRGRSIAGRLLHWIASMLYWFEDRLVLRGGGEGLVEAIQRVGRYANRIETLLSKPRYLLLLIMATFAVIL